MDIGSDVGGDDPLNGVVVFLVFIFFLALVGALVFECWVLYESYRHADSIECAWYGCTYVTTRRSSEVVTDVVESRVSSRSCFLNGVAVNCSVFDGGRLT